MLQNNSRFIVWQGRIMISAAIIGLVISIIIAWVYTTQRTDSKSSFNYSVLGDKSNFSTFFKNFFPLFLNFMSAIPINFVLISKISMLIYSKFIEWDVHTYTVLSKKLALYQKNLTLCQKNLTPYQNNWHYINKI